MNQRTGMLAAALCLVISGGVAAGEDGRSEPGGVENPLLEQALEQLRAEQQLQVQARARLSLAQMHSEVATALAQGATTAAGLSINAAP